MAAEDVIMGEHALERVKMTNKEKSYIRVNTLRDAANATCYRCSRGGHPSIGTDNVFRHMRRNICYANEIRHMIAYELVYGTSPASSSASIGEAAVTTNILEMQERVDALEASNHKDRLWRLERSDNGLHECITSLTRDLDATMKRVMGIESARTAEVGRLEAVEAERSDEVDIVGRRVDDLAMRVGSLEVVDAQEGLASLEEDRVSNGPKRVRLLEEKCRDAYGRQIKHREGLDGLAFRMRTVEKLAKDVHVTSNLEPLKRRVAKLEDMSMQVGSMQVAIHKLQGKWPSDGRQS